MMESDDNETTENLCQVSSCHSFGFDPHRPAVYNPLYLCVMLRLSDSFAVLMLAIFTGRLLGMGIGSGSLVQLDLSLGMVHRLR